MYIYGAYPRCGSLFKDNNKMFIKQVKVKEK